MANKQPGRQELNVLLKALRDEPANSQGNQTQVLNPLWDFLMKTPPDASDGLLHWFCSRPDPLVREAATFLTRLFAYDSSRVTQWKEKLSKCLRGCAGCAKGLQDAKLSSRLTYFGAFPQATLDTFWNSFVAWERDVLLDSLAKAGFSLSSTLALADIPFPTIYHIFSHPSLYSDPKLHSALCRLVPSKPLSTSPYPPPAAIVYALVDQDENIREWASQQIRLYSSRSWSPSDFSDYHVDAVRGLLSSLDNPSQSTQHGSIEPRVLWAALPDVLRQLPRGLLLPAAKSLGFEIRRVVSSHLHDAAPHFQFVLKSLIFLLRRLGSGFWDNEDIGFPQVIFDAVKDNPQYTLLLASSTAVTWHLDWFSDYLDTFWDLPAWGEVLAKTIYLLCGEAQHEGFKDVKPVVIVPAAQLLQRIVSKHRETAIGATRLDALTSAVDIHTDLFISVAFSRDYADEKWMKARKASRELIKALLISDTEDLAKAITVLCVCNVQDTVVSVPAVHHELWTKVYGATSSKDQEASGMLLGVVSRIAHQDILSDHAFGKAIERTKDATTALHAVNAGLISLRNGFRAMISGFAEDNSPSILATFLRQPGTVKNLVALLMSPVDDYQFSIAMVEQAYDVDGRRDSFRALFNHMPDQSYDGVFFCLERITAFIPTVPEACKLSKAVVNCLTDIIDALSSRLDGLFQTESHLAQADRSRSPASNISQLWAYMAKMSTAIFSRTPKWSRYFEDERDMMIGWMRDAMIFGRDMVAQRRSFASAILSSSGAQTNSRSSRAERRLVEDLHPFLPALMTWLRLTDFELLHQAFALLESLLECFQSTGVKPDKGALSKLRDHVRKKQTRLDASQLSKLEQTLSSFDDDDVEIVERPETAAAAGSFSSKGVAATQPSSTPSVPAKVSQRRAGPAGPLLAKSVGPKVVSTVVAPTKYRKPNGRNFGDNRSSSPLDPPVVSTVRTVVERKDILRNTKNEGGAGASSEGPSSDGSDSEEEEGPKGLAALAKLQSTPKIKKPTKPRQIMMMNDADVGMKTSHNDRLRRRDDARRTAMRLKPDLSGLHRIILSWDYEYTGETPPSSSFQKPIHVNDAFKNYESYRRTFESLLILECWAQLFQSKSEAQDTRSFRITSRQTVDDWVDIEVLFSDTIPREWSLSDTDIVLLRQRDTKKYTLAKVQSYRSTFQQTQCSFRCYLGAGLADPGLHIGIMWTVTKVFSLTTLHREFGALVGLQYFDFVDGILQPQLHKPARFSSDMLQRAMVSYNVNEPQAAAILGAMEAEQFCLIQGPPGTGKTTTICSLVKACLAKRAHPVADPSRTERLTKPKILICAPSNAAIDEVASRLKDKVEHVIRLGAGASINVKVKDISLDALIDEKMASTSTSKDALKGVGNQVRDLRAQLDAVKALRQQKEDEFAQIHDNIERSRVLDDEIRKLKQQRTNLTHQMDKLKDQQRDGSRTMDALRRRFRTDVMQEADVICSTLSGAGHDLLEQFDSFEMIIIDEAAQAVELSSLIPLKYRSKRCVMVGDPQQLPPTVLSQEAKKYKYDQSLFVRLQKQRPDAVHLLSIQYRMHPEISQLPSEVFYSSRLLDGPDMDKKTQQPWHGSSMFPPYRFLNVQGQETSASKGSSLVNKAECQIAVALYNRIRTEFSVVDFSYRIGVVSMYRAQVAELRRAFQDRFGHDIAITIDFNTVDGFQGQEKDIIILSCVRATPGGTTVGFLADVRRMNVALTRARSSLFILGNAATLQRSDENWKSIVANARSRLQYVDATIQYFTQPTTSIMATPNPPFTTTAHKRKASTDAAPSDLVMPREAKKLVLSRSAAEVHEPTNVPDPVPHSDSSSSRLTDAQTTNNANNAARTDRIPSSPDRRAVVVQKAPPKRKPKDPTSAMFIPRKR